MRYFVAYNKGKMMSKFIKNGFVEKVRTRSTDEVIEIFRFKKEGTERIFYAGELFNGKRISTTMFQRLSECRTFCKLYLNRVK